MIQIRSLSTPGSASNTTSASTNPTTVSCVNGAFSASLNLSSIPDGEISLSLLSSTGVQLLDSGRRLSKDTLAPIASLLAPPPAINALLTINSGVTATDTTHYKFKIGSAASVDCAVSTVYSAAVAISTPINASVESLPDGPLRLCVIAGDANGNWQTSATIANWTKNTAVPTAVVSGLPTHDSNASSFSATISGTDVTHYRMKFGLSTASDCAVESGYSAEADVATPLSLSASSGEGLYKLCVVGRSSASVWQSFANATQVSWMRDTSVPVLAILSPTSSSILPSSSLASSTVTSSCSEIGRTVIITATSAVNSTQVSASGTCLSSSVSVNLNLSALPDGNISFVASQSDLAGNSGSSPSITAIKDAIAPNVSALALIVPKDDWSTSESPTLSWVAANEGSGVGVARYEIALGTAPGLSDVLAWTSVGTALSYKATGLSLTRGHTYHASIRAVDAAGNVSAPISGSNGWLVNSELWSTDGWVSAIAKVGTKVYIGGFFSKIYQPIGFAMPMNASSGQAAWPNAAARARVRGAVHAIVSDGNGGFFLGGSFRHVSNTERNNVVRILSDGSIDPAFNPNVNGQVTSLALEGSILYIGGTFTSVGTSSRANLAAVSSADGSLVSAFSPSTNGSVNAIVAASGSLFIGGKFTSVNGETRHRVAMISSATGALAAIPTPNVDGDVHTLALSGTTLYLGGAFMNIGDAPRARLAALDITTGSVLAIPNLAFDGSVHTALVSGSKLYVGGEFNEPDSGVARPNIAAITIESGTVDTSFNPPGWYGYVYALAMSDSALYVGGHLAYLSGVTTANYGRVSALDPNTGAAISSFKQPPIAGATRAIAVQGSTLYAGSDGPMDTEAGVARKNLAALSLEDGSVDPSFNLDSNGDVTELAVSGSNLYVAGNFTSLGGQARSRLAAISLADHSVSQSFKPNVNLTVYSMLIADSKLYFGGSFTSVNDTPRNRIAAVSLADGALDASFDPNADGDVMALARSGSTLYAGGSFASIGGLSRKALAALSMTDGAADPAFDANILNRYAYVYDLSIDAAKLYLAGEFESIGGMTRQNIAAVSATNGELVQAFNPDVNDIVVEIEAVGPTVYLAGAFTSINGKDIQAIGAISSTTGAPYTGFNAGEFTGSISSFWRDGSSIYAGGDFYHATGAARVLSIHAVSGAPLHE